MTSTHEGVEDRPWGVELFRAVRDGNLDFVEHLVTRHPDIPHQHLHLDDWELEWDSLKW